MTKPMTTLSALALAAGIALGAATVIAAPAAAPANGQMQAQGPEGPRGAMRDRVRARIHARAQAVHDALNLRPNQEAAWAQMVQDMKAGRGARGHGRMNPQAMEGLTTPQRLDMLAQRMAERQAGFARRAEAIKRFYAGLDPAQQHTFDAMARLEQDMGGGGRGRHRMGADGAPRGDAQN